MEDALPWAKEVLRHLGPNPPADGGQLASRDAGDLGGPSIVQDVPGDGRLE